MTTITIPESFADRARRAGVVIETISVSGWELSAILASLVRLGQSEEDKRYESPKSLAKLEWRGLASPKAITWRVQAWLDASGGVYPEAGERVDLPDELFPTQAEVEKRHKVVPIKSEPVWTVEKETSAIVIHPSATLAQCRSERARVRADRGVTVARLETLDRAAEALDQMIEALEALGPEEVRDAA